MMLIIFSAIMQISKEILFATECYSDSLELPNENWWYYSLDIGQHICFYSKKTLIFFADKYGLYYYQINNMHWFTTKKIRFI